MMMNEDSFRPFTETNSGLGRIETANSGDKLFEASGTAVGRTPGIINS